MISWMNFSDICGWTQFLSFSLSPHISTPNPEITLVYRWSPWCRLDCLYMCSLFWRHELQTQKVSSSGLGFLLFLPIPAINCWAKMTTHFPSSGLGWWAEWSSATSADEHNFLSFNLNPHISTPNPEITLVYRWSPWRCLECLYMCSLFWRHELQIQKVSSSGLGFHYFFTSQQ